MGEAIRKPMQRREDQSFNMGKDAKIVEEMVPSVRLGTTFVSSISEVNSRPEAYMSIQPSL